MKGLKILVNSDYNEGPQELLCLPRLCAIDTYLEIQLGINGS